MIRRVYGWAMAGALAGGLLSPASHAQRTDDNVTAESDDAFGRSIGNEVLGIYNPGEVRGFSPTTAGNVRIEGLYFDRQTDPSFRLVEGSAIRVGIASQSYPFPSPTGIVDYNLRDVGGKRIISPVLTYGPYGGMGIQLDAQFPIIGETFGLAIGGELDRNGFGWGGENHSNHVAIAPRWQPTEEIELRPFFSRVWFWSEEPQSLLFTADGRVPPKISRKHYFGPAWATSEGDAFTYGFLGKANAGEWTVRLGVFESSYVPNAEYADLYTDIDSTGYAREQVIAFQESRFASKSGELRATRTFEAGERRHTILFSARGRLQQRRYGGEDVVDLGDMQLGVAVPSSEPVFDFGPQSHDEVRQTTGGIGYELRWKNRGEMSIGVQKTHYTKTIDTPEGPLPETRANPTLKNVTATVYASDRVAFYGSYTQGLEESPVAPSNAINRSEAAPAIDTKQYDAGVRWQLAKNLKVIAGVFNVEKPYFDLDLNRRFTQLGTVRHRGIEMSLAGNPLESLTVVAGTRFLDATVSGPLVDNGIIGETPVGVFRNYALISADYVITGTPFSVDSMVESVSRQMATTLNTAQSPSRVVVHLGGRYRFKMFGKPAVMRAQWNNVFARYGWSVISGGAYVYNNPRRFSIYVATDL